MDRQTAAAADNALDIIRKYDAAVPAARTENTLSAREDFVADVLRAAFLAARQDKRQAGRRQVAGQVRRGQNGRLAKELKELLSGQPRRIERRDDDEVCAGADKEVGRVLRESAGAC